MFNVDLSYQSFFLHQAVLRVVFPIRWQLSTFNLDVSQYFVEMSSKRMVNVSEIPSICQRRHRL